MNMKKQLFYLIVLASLMGCLAWSCTNNAKKIKNVKVVTEAQADSQLDCTDPHCRILIQPYDNFSQERATEVSKQLKKALNDYVKGLAVSEVKVLPNKPLTADLMNEAKTRYRASKILDRQASLMQQHDDVVIGLTDNDISTTLHGYEDWGILGLSYVNRNNCVISTFRVKDKSQFWKVVLHEFGHGFLGLDHCPNNDHSCFMVDCNGKPEVEKEFHFCDSCSKRIPD